MTNKKKTTNPTASVKKNKKEADYSYVGTDLPSAFDLFRPSWDAIKINISTLVSLIIIPSLLLILFQYHYTGYGVNSVFLTIKPGGWLILSLFTLSVFAFGPGIFYTLLQGAKKKKVNLSTAFNTGMGYFWRFIGLSVCLFVITFIGFALFIVPGFFMLRRFLLAEYYMIDRDLSILETLKVCGRESKEFSGAVWGIIGVWIIICFVGSFLVLIPVLGALAFLIIEIIYSAAPAVRYLQITRAIKTES